MMGTCDGGRESFNFNSLHVLQWALRREGLILIFISFSFFSQNTEYAVSTLQPGYTYFGPRGPDDSDLCECSTVGYSLFSACAACQGEEWITYGFCPFFFFFFFFFQSYHVPINSWSEWAKNCTRTMPPGSYVCKKKTYLRFSYSHFVIWPARRFPNPVPSGIRVPQWALIDVTVRFQLLLLYTFITAKKKNCRKRTNGTPTNHIPSVVSTHLLSLIFFSSTVTVPTSTTHPHFSKIDNPELTPDAILGPSTASVAPTSTSSMIPSTTPIAVHNSNTGAIVGGVLGGIGGILIVIAAVFFYRQRRPQAPSAVFDGVESPVPMKFYVCILAPRVVLVCPHSAPLGPRRPPGIP